MSTCKANLKTWMLAAAAALAIILSSGLPADAASYEYKEYTVKKGDTLWSITKRELVDAYQWPLVWMENRRINDPDLIFPGQVILIPIRMQKPDEPEGSWPRPETASRDIAPSEPSYWTPPAYVEPEKPTYQSKTSRISKQRSKFLVK